MPHPSAAPSEPTRAERTPRLAGVAFVMFLIAGGAANLWAFAAGDERLVTAPFTTQRFLQGEVTAEIGKSLAKAPLPAHAAALERGTTWLALGELGPRVRRGCGDWLFLADEITPQADAQQHANARAELVRQTAQRLRERGIALQVVVVPDKTRVQSHALCTLTRPASLAPRAQAFTQALQHEGIAALDLTDALSQSGRDMYLRTDTHWSELGANTAAQALARALGALPEARAGYSPALHTEQRLDSPRQVAGDLIRLAGVDALPARWQPAADRVATSVFTPITQTSAQSAEDLFGDAQLPSVALVGSSFAGASNFVPWLAHHLRSPVANFAKDGGAFAGAISAYLHGAAYRDTPPRVLVWEIPERDLQTPLGTDEAELSRWLTAPASGASR